jgi:signal transduction histidine kinase/CheY-like chemotaxis protein
MESTTPQGAWWRPAAWPLQAQLVVVALASVVAMWLIVAGLAFAVVGAVRREEVENSGRDIQRARALLVQRARHDRDRAIEYGGGNLTYDAMGSAPATDPQKWFADNFVAWFPSHYGDRLVGLFDREGRAWLIWTDSSAAWLPDSISRSAILPRLPAERSMAGVYWAGGRPWLVAGALVPKPRVDSITGATLARGYLVVAQPLSGAVLAGFGEELQQQVSIEPAGPAAADDAWGRRVYADGDSVQTSFTLRDVLGAPSTVVVLRSSREHFRRIELWVPRFLAAAGGVALLLLGLLWFGGDCALVRPLGHFATELDAMQRDGKLRTLPPPSSAPEWVLLTSAFNRTVETQHEVEAARDGAISARDAKAAFLANMSHEIRTPMNGVLGMLDLLLDTELRPDQRERARTAYRSAEGLLTILDDILDFSKIEAGRLELETVDFDLRGILEEITTLLSERAARKGVQVASTVSDAVPGQVRGDPGRLRQVLLNLAGNAIKFTEQGEVVLRAQVERVEDEFTVVRFEVSDTGIGISPELRDRLFVPFSQADASTTRRYGGTGLGLAISKQLVELMAGELGVESVQGAGSTFWFTARFAQAEPLDQEPFESHDSLCGIRVLIVDDHRTTRVALERHLRSWGIACDAAEGAEHGLTLLHRAAAEDRPYAVALIDLHAAGEDGVPLARRIRSDSAHAGMRLVQLGAMARGPDAEARGAAGIDAFLAKPVRESALYDCLAILMGPLSAAAALPPTTRARRAGTGGGTIRILLADDNEVNQQVALGLLERYGHQVDVVGNGVEAVAAVERVVYDLVLMDCQMPEMDGFRATQEIRRRRDGRPRLPIVAMTAGAMKGDRERCLAAGMDDYVPKPINREKLDQLFRRWPIGWKPAGASPAAEPQPSTPAPARLVLNLGQLRSIVGDDPPSFRKYLSLFETSADTMVTQLGSTIALRDAEAAGRVAHKLKGVCGSIGAEEMAELSLRMEAALRLARWEEAERLQTGLVGAFDRAREAIAAV